MSARLHRALSWDPKIFGGFPHGCVCNSRGEILELLLTTHFHNLEVIEEVAAPAAAHRARRHDWRMAVRVVTYRILLPQTKV